MIGTFYIKCIKILYGELRQVFANFWIAGQINAFNEYLVVNQRNELFHYALQDFWVDEQTIVFIIPLSIIDLILFQDIRELYDLR